VCATKFLPTNLYNQLLYRCYMFTSDNGGGRLHAIAGVCLSVSKITQKRVDGFGLNVACRRMSGHGGTD